MNKKRKKQIEKLQQMLHEKEPEEPVEKVLVLYCARNGVSLDTCREYYQFLVDSGKIEGP
jgi:hypothetical protein